ncbi:hypothetical protein F4803DRAFT_538395 [Xylaria telfairii]|nr:hypothetical protein F4803DRAFT_538395 [Xylaria telfairii]
MACDTLSTPRVDNSYAERVAYRIKKWSGIKLEKPPRSSRKMLARPHEEELCEGCKAGHCGFSDPYSAN